MKKYTLKTIKHYNSIADDYFKSNAALVVKDKIDRFIGFIKRKQILDIACGPGHDTNYLIKKGFDCLGIDLSEKMIRIAKKNNQGDFKIMDFFNMPFEDNSFDGIWCSSALVHVAKKDLPELLTNIRRILKNDGILGIITVKKQKTSRDKYDKRAYFMYDKDELENYLRKDGYKILVSNTFIYGDKKRLFLIVKNKKDEKRF